MLVGLIDSKFTERFEWPSVWRSSATLLTTGEKTCCARIARDREADRPEAPWRPALFITIVLMNFVLIAWLPPARAQIQKPTLPTPVQKATVPVRELQIPAKARGAFLRGLEGLAKGDAAGSVGQFKRAIQEFPDFYEAYYNEGIAETQLHQENNAMQSFQKAIDLSGGHYARAYVGYSLVLVQLGRSEEAEPMVRQGLEEDPRLSDGHAVLSLVLFNQNRLDDAEEAAHTALRMPNPAARNAVLMLAHIHLKRGEYRSAVQDLEDYLQTICSTPCKDNTESTQYVRKLLSEAQAKSVGQDPAGELQANIR